jgi:hypothetical protein
MRKPTVTESLVDIDLALAIREIVRTLGLKVPKGNLKFRCPSCDYAVKPHEEGKSPDGSLDPAHFEHLPGHPADCPSS